MKHKFSSRNYLVVALLTTVGINSSLGGPINNIQSDPFRNTAGGFGVLFQNVGFNNTGFGYVSLNLNSNANDNTAFGAYSLSSNTTGSSNTANGSMALRRNTTGSANTAHGINALFSNTSGSYNSAFGTNALLSNTSSVGNTAIGLSALSKSSSGSTNTAIGFQTLLNKTSGGNNLALGQSAGKSLIIGNNNIYLSNVGVSSESSTIRIGNVTDHTRTFIAGIRGKKTATANAVPVVIDSNGQLGTIKSSVRFKKDIHDMKDASAHLLELRPVTYYYKEASEDGSNPLEYGLIAEEVAKIYPDLVVYGQDGKIETVQYHKLTPMLVNELKRMNSLLQTEKDKNLVHAQEIANLKQQMKVLQTKAESIETLTSRLARIEANQTLGMGKTAIKKLQNLG